MRAGEAAPAARARMDTHAPYERLSAAERYIHITRDRDMLALLRRHGFEQLSGRRILELGCGDGSLLRSLVHYGAEARALQGIDIVAARVGPARSSLAGARVTAADIASLPYQDNSFDLAFAFTVLSSVLDERTRRAGATEAMRVLRPGGLLVVYDFSVNPTNPRVRPLRAPELRDLFAPRQIEIERVTLAPPIVRLLAGRGGPCGALERLPFLRTHLLAAVAKEG